jgi:hypothetical protein
VRCLPLIAAALLAACSDREPGPSSEPAGENRGVAPKAEAGIALPAAEAPAPANSLSVLTAEGWGPLRIGMTREEVTKALGPDADPEAVGGPNPDSCDEFRPIRAPKGMLVMIEEGRLTRISLVRGAAVKTDRGLGIGATASAVRAAYGAALMAEPHKYVPAPAEYLTIWSGGSPAPDAVRGPAARGIRYSIEKTGRVAQIHSGRPSIDYVEGCL